MNILIFVLSIVILLVILGLIIIYDFYIDFLEDGDIVLWYTDPHSGERLYKILRDKSKD